jgi:hypothetical protein
MVEPLVYPWLSEDVITLSRANSFAAIAKVALGALARMPVSPYLISGPINTGGKGNAEGNLRAYKRAIAYVERQGKSVFNQLVAEMEFRRLYKAWIEKEGDKYPWPILHEFYEPIFRSGKIKGIYSMPDWQSSTGARWERELSISLSLEVHDLPYNWEEYFEITLSER